MEPMPSFAAPFTRSPNADASSERLSSDRLLSLSITPHPAAVVADYPPACSREDRSNAVARTRSWSVAEEEGERELDVQARRCPRDTAGSFGMETSAFGSLGGSGESRLRLLPPLARAPPDRHGGDDRPNHREHDEDADDPLERRGLHPREDALPVVRSECAFDAEAQHPHAREGEEETPGLQLDGPARQHEGGEREGWRNAAESR